MTTGYSRLPDSPNSSLNLLLPEKSDNKFCIKAIFSFETVDETRGMKSHGVTIQIKPL